MGIGRDPLVDSARFNQLLAGFFLVPVKHGPAFLGKAPDPLLEILGQADVGKGLSLRI